MTTLEPLRWQITKHVYAAFSTAADGDLRDDSKRQDWLHGQTIYLPCAVGQQVHGTTIVHVDHGSHEIPMCDGLVTTNSRLALGAFGADCPGIALVAPDAMGIAHAGWRGTAGGIASTLIAAMARITRHSPESWSAFIGPGIAGSAYEVDVPVLSARKWPETAVVPTRPGHALLDLRLALAADCHQHGITSVTICSTDTANDSRLHSYRHGGRGPIQMLVVWRSD